MDSTTFARARSAEQREARRAGILAVAADMLAADVRVGDLTLNELSRRVGLAKSNVLRYFETREAVLLELLGNEFDTWLDVLAVDLAGRAPGVEPVAEAVAGTLADRPVLAELLANAPGVLERNVSADVAATYKRRSAAQAARLVRLIESRLAPLPDTSRIALGGAVILIAGGTWSLCRPSPGMLAAYEADPALAAMLPDYRVAVRELVATVLAGLLARSASAAP